MLLLDLDDFKVVNDTYSHLMGDQLLMAVARRLEAATRATDTICRFGGDEFLYLVDGVATRFEAEQVATRLLETLVETFPVGEASVEQRASVGIVVWDEASSGYNEIIQEADLALYEANRRGKGHHFVFPFAKKTETTDD